MAKKNSRVRLILLPAFTFIELLIVIAIIGILSVAIFSYINPTTRIKQAQDATRVTNSNQIQTSVADFFIAHGTYPPDPAVSTDTEFASDAGPNWIPGLENLPQDPTQALVKTFLANLISGQKQQKGQVAGTSSQEFTADSINGGRAQMSSPNYPPENGACRYEGSGWWNGDYTGIGQAYYPTLSEYRKWRGYLTFDTSTLPHNVYITSVKLELFGAWSFPPPATPDTLNVRIASPFTITSTGQNYTFVCPSGTWQGTPPTGRKVGSYTVPANYQTGSIPYSIDIAGNAVNLSGLTQFILATDRDEKNIAPIDVNQSESIWFSQSDNSDPTHRPRLLVEYSTEPPASNPTPTPSPAPKGCKNKKHIYCYMVTTDHKSAIIWAQLDNGEDDRLYYKPTAKCKNTPPPDSFFNYCINNP